MMKTLSGYEQKKIQKVQENNDCEDILSGQTPKFHFSLAIWLMRASSGEA